MKRITIRNLLRVAGLAALLSMVSATTPAYRPPFGEWRRLHNGEPILVPQGNGWEANGVFNAAAVKHDGKIVLIYRAQDKNMTSRLGYAESTDGVHFVRRPEPIFGPREPYEELGGTEDPRLVKIGDTYYLTYVAWNRVTGKRHDKSDGQIALATSKDLINWERKGIIFPAYQGRWNKGWTKAGAIIPQKINGKWWMYYMGEFEKGNWMGVASSDDLIHWTDATDQPVLPGRPGMFDEFVVEPGPPPVVTEEGILMVYNSSDRRINYSAAWALFDKNDPTKVLARADTPLLTPQRPWEKHGQVPNIIFVEGLVRDGQRWLFYYNGGDKHIGVAEALSR
jgi:predicted GH43/DUF377 family glycosyl hydrolase